MGKFTVIRPKDDAEARQASRWCDDLIADLSGKGHIKIVDIDDYPNYPDGASISSALKQQSDIVFYFGHGDENAWITSRKVTIDSRKIKAARGKAVVSIACKTGRNLGPNAVTAGVTCWLGFSIKVPVVGPNNGRDPFGEAIVKGLSCLGAHKSMQQAHDDLYDALDKLVDEFDNGVFKHHKAANLGYFGAMSLRDQIVIQGKAKHRPLP
jgi:hypothetical protein